MQAMKSISSRAQSVKDSQNPKAYNHILNIGLLWKPRTHRSPGKT